MGENMKWEFVAFDLDGVFVDIISSWVWIHDHFGVNNDASLMAYMRGEIDDFEFMRRDIALWHDKKERLHVNELKKILSNVPMIPGAKETIEALKFKGIKTAIISGGLDILGNKVAEELNIDHVVANGLKLDEDGYLLGEGILKVVLMDKGKALLKLLKEMNIEPGKCVSIGNSHIDVPMFECSGLGIAFNPSDALVREKADIVIEKKDLREILRYIF